MNVEKAEELLEQCILENIEKCTPESEHIEQELLNFLYKETGNVQYLHSLLPYLKDMDVNRYQKALLDTIAKGFDCNWYSYGQLLESGELGYIDEEEAYRCYEKAAVSIPRGNRSAVFPLTDNRGFAKLRMAEMCREGIGTKQDIERCRELIDEVDHDFNSSEFAPEEQYILMAKADLALYEGEKERAIELLLECRKLAVNLLEDFYFRDELEYVFKINDRLYQLGDPDGYDLDIYDLSEILKRPHTVQVAVRDRHLCISSVKEEGVMIYSLNGQWFRELPDLFEAKIDEDSLFYELRNEIVSVEIVE